MTKWTGADSKWQIDVEHSSWRFTNVGSLAVSTSANRLAGGGARPTFGSPALRNGEYCYFHRRWRMTTVDLSHSAHHVTSEFVLPVLEDAESIQITLGQVMRMIVCRQVDTKSAGLLLYGLQIASANLRRTGFEPYHRNVTVDLFRVPERIIGDEAWSPADFQDANVGNVGRAPTPAKPSSAKDARVARTPSSAKESCVVATLPEPQPEPSPLAVLLSAKETHVARTPLP